MSLFYLTGLQKRMYDLWHGSHEIGKDPCLCRYIIGMITSLILIKACIILDMVRFFNFLIILLGILICHSNGTHLKYVAFGIVHGLSFLLIATIIFESNRETFYGYIFSIFVKVTISFMCQLKSLRWATLIN